MLRIIQNASAQGAKSYYSTADYYTEGQEQAGTWRGLAAERLGLSGKVERDQWDQLCDNIDPSTGRTLTARTRQNRTVGYDVNFHAPKSLSLLHALTQDERLLAAFRDAMGETMREMERELKTRVRTGGRDEDRVAGSAAWGEFIHYTSRPVGGIPDPQLHGHCFVFNAVYDPEEKRFKAGNFKEMKRDAPYFEAVFHAKLAGRIADLGLPVGLTRHGWEIGTLDRATLEKFSRRTAQIDAEAKAKGITGEAKAELGAKTRERKAKNLSMPQLRDEWRSRLTDAEARAVALLAARIGQEPHPRDERTAAVDAVRLAASHSFERNSVVPERTLLRESLRRSYGAAPREAVEAEAARLDLIRADREGRKWVTTPEVLAEETAVVTFARRGRGTQVPLGNGRPHTFARTWLNDGQKRAVRHVLECTDRIMIVRGGAGVGKTTMMSEAVEAIEAGGTKVVTVAPSAGASRGELRAAGFADADTVARLLVDPDMQERLRGSLLLVDEAGLIGMPTMKKLFDLSEKFDCRILLCGDRRQHGSVDRGAALRLLESDAGLISAEVTEIQRQRGSYRKVIEHLSEGRVTEAFGLLDRLGWIKEVPDAERYQAIADEYVASAVRSEKTLVIAPTHSEGQRASQAIRLGLRQAGLLGREERTFDALAPANLTAAERADHTCYNDGDVIIYHQNALGHKKGARLTAGKDPLPLDQAERFTAYRRGTLTLAAGDRVRVTANGRDATGKHRLNNGDLHTVSGFNSAGDIELANGWTVGRGFGFLAPGFVTTSFSSQGKTVDKVILAASAESFPATSQEQIYVSTSRGRSAVSVFTHSKQDLLDAARRADDRLTATDLVAGRDHRERALQLQRTLAPPIPPGRNPEPAREASYER
jgi:conjugative relaxase-like TrwC/TraI family protein